MEQTILSGALVVSLALLNPSSLNHIDISTHQINQQEMREYRVLEGDSITSIAEKIYGSEDFSEVLINDNNWIDNPDIIEKGWTLKIRNTKPLKTTLTMQEKSITDVIIPEETAQPINKPSAIPSTSQNNTISELSTQSFSNGPLNDAQINFLGNCEAGMNPSRNSGNGYYGAFQFSYGTWQSMNTGYERADLAPIEVQIDAVQRLIARSSIFTQFPGCARRMQAEGIL